MPTCRTLLFSVIFLLLPLLNFQAQAQGREQLRYNELYRKACHNCYEKRFAPSLADALNHVRSIEIDFYDTPDKGTTGQPREWFVRHNAHSPTPNDNCCTGPNNLAGCLQNVLDWSRSHPGHEVITIFLDKKEGWTPGHSPEELDQLLLSVFPREKIFSPADLKGNYKTAREAAAAGAWPTMGQLQGKVIFALTGGPGGSRNLTHHEYVGSRGEKALIFVAPDAKEPADLTAQPEQFTAETGKWIVFYNMRKGFEAIAPAIQAGGFVVRVWGAPENDATFQGLVHQKVHFIAMDNYKESSFNGGSMSGPFPGGAPPAGKKGKAVRSAKSK
jgi:hypothetical protein